MLLIVDMKKKNQDILFLAKWLDNDIPTPFGYKIGMDGLIGLVPGVGDFITNLLSAYIILRAIVLGIPISIILKMVMNLLFENIVDLIPIIGNFFDFYWQSNQKNVSLMTPYLKESGLIKKRSFKKLALLIPISFLILLFLIILFLWLSYYSLSWLFSFI